MKAQVIARLTVTRQDGKRTIVEVPADATYHAFYHMYTQQGARRSTKRLVRTANRNEGLPITNAHLHRPGLERLQERLESFGAQTNPVTKSQIRIIRKRAYRKLLEAAPDTLGLVKAPTFTDVRLLPKPILRYPVHIPSNHTTIKKRVSILLGRR